MGNFKETEAVLTEKFAELLQQFYQAGITNPDISMKQFLDEMTESLEGIIMTNV